MLTEQYFESQRCANEDYFPCLGEDEALKIVDEIKKCKNLLEEQLPWSARIYPKIVLGRTGDWNKYREAVSLCDVIYTCARNIDLYYETGLRENFEKYETAMNQLLEKCSANFGIEFSREFDQMQQRLAKFFLYEKQLCDKLRFGLLLNEDEIKKYSLMRASDSLLHAKIVEGFTGEDWSSPMWVCMQLKDLSNDLFQYKKDISTGLPNVYSFFRSHECEFDPEANDISKYADNGVELIKDSLMETIKDFEYKNCIFLREEINFLRSVRHHDI